MSRARAKYADVYARVMASAGTGQDVRVPLGRQNWYLARAQMRRYLADRGYRVAITREGTTMVCRAERQPVPAGLVPAYSGARILDAEGRVLRVVPALELARRRIERHATTDHLIPPHARDALAPTVPIESTRAPGRRSWAANSF